MIYMGNNLLIFKSIGFKPWEWSAKLRSPVHPYMFGLF